MYCNIMLYLAIQTCIYWPSCIGLCYMAIFETQMYQNNVQLFGDDILVDQAMHQQKFTQVVLQRDSSAVHNCIKTLSIAFVLHKLL